MKASAMEQTAHLPSSPTPKKLGDALATTEQIRTLNDAFRSGDLSQAWGVGRILLTERVNRLSWADKFALMQCVKAFDDFNNSNDPHGEHDFGAFQFQGERYFWKIDYYDRSLKQASPDPTDTAVTCRVLTVMHASEY